MSTVEKKSKHTKSGENSTVEGDEKQNSGKTQSKMIKKDSLFAITVAECKV